MTTPPARRFFFIHVMKTAGTSLSRQLQHHFTPVELYPSRGLDYEDLTDLDAYISVPRLAAIPDERRRQVHMYTGHFPYMAAALVDPDLRKLTLLRDPVDRTVSVLKHFKRREERFRSATLEMIYDDPEISRCYVDNYQTKIFAFVPTDGVGTVQQPMVVDDTRLQLAKDNLEHVEFVGLTEQFAEFIDQLRAELGWWPAGADRNDRTNKSPEAWDVKPTLRERIAAENPYDVELYRYTCEFVAPAPVIEIRSGRR